MRFGVWELVIILVIALLIFGPSRLPDLGKAIGKTIQGFKRASKEEESAETVDAAKEAANDGKDAKKA